MIFLNVMPMEVEACKAKLSTRTLLVRCKSEPLEGLLKVLGSPVSVCVHVAQVCHGLMVALIGSLVKVMEGLFGQKICNSMSSFSTL
jgi:hypothetical protein